MEFSLHVCCWLPAETWNSWLSPPCCKSPKSAQHFLILISSIWHVDIWYSVMDLFSDCLEYMETHSNTLLSANWFLRWLLRNTWQPLFLKVGGFKNFFVQLDVQDDSVESFCSIHVPNITCLMSGELVTKDTSHIIGHLSLQSLEAEWTV
jgi:hypothetical protein